MIALLAAVLLQAPDDLPSFLAQLEKDRAGGSTNAELLQKIDAWDDGKPDAVLARLAWNRGLLEATIKLDAWFAVGLTRRVGKRVSFGRTSGTVKEVKADRAVLAVAGGAADLLFSAVPLDQRLDDVRKQQLLPERSAEEAILRFATDKSAAALGPARAIPEGDDPARAFSAIAGWILQEADRDLAAGTVSKAAEDFAPWAKQPEFADAFRTFIDQELGPRLVAEADAIAESDRKGARKLLDLAASLCQGEEISMQVRERRWAVLDKGEWMPIPLDATMYDGGSLKGTRLAWEDPVKDVGKMLGLKITSLPVSWDEIAGVKARVKPVKAEALDMRFQFGDRSVAVTVSIAQGMGYTVEYRKDKEGRMGAGSSRKVPKRSEYELAAQWDGKRWTFAIAGVEIDKMEIEETPGTLHFLTDNGSAELLSLQVRRR